MTNFVESAITSQHHKMQAPYAAKGQQKSPPKDYEIKCKRNNNNIQKNVW